MSDFGFATNREIAAELGARLRGNRLTQNISQAELALRAGVSEGTVKNIESTGQASTLSLLGIVQALGLTDELATLFEVRRPLSIAQMEQLEGIKRKRASRALPKVAS